MSQNENLILYMDMILLDINKMWYVKFVLQQTLYRINNTIIKKVVVVYQGFLKV